MMCVGLSTTTAFSPMAGSLQLRSTSRLSASSSAGLHKAHRQSHGMASRLSMQQEGGSAPPLERLVGCLPYVLPLADGFEWGRYVFEQIPLLALPFVPLFPVMSFLNAPFVSFGIFIFLFSFVARNPEYSRFVRFNTLQAIYLDIALIFPQLFKSIMGATGGLPSEIGVPLTNTVFYAMIFSVTYSLFKNVQGETPNEIPLISESVESQMPF